MRIRIKVKSRIRIRIEEEMGGSLRGSLWRIEWSKSENVDPQHSSDNIDHTHRIGIEIEWQDHVFCYLWDWPTPYGY
jgi:hypothetical protein